MSDLYTRGELVRAVNNARHTTKPIADILFEVKSQEGVEYVDMAECFFAQFQETLGKLADYTDNEVTYCDVEETVKAAMQVVDEWREYMRELVVELMSDDLD